MSGYTEQGEVQRRAIYLHEAGHVVVAIECGLRIKSVHCDGEAGCVDQETPASTQGTVQQLKRQYQAQSITLDEYVTRSIDAYSGLLTSLLGGIAGESLESGRAIISTRRASDDIPSFFGILSVLTAGLPVIERDGLWQRVFESCQDRAWGIVRRNEKQVRHLADKLELSGMLDEAQVKEALLFATR